MDRTRLFGRLAVGLFIGLGLAGAVFTVGAAWFWASRSEWWVFPMTLIGGFAVFGPVWLTIRPAYRNLWNI